MSRILTIEKNDGQLQPWSNISAKKAIAKRCLSPLPSENPFMFDYSLPLHLLNSVFSSDSFIMLMAANSTIQQMEKHITYIVSIIRILHPVWKAI